MRTVLWVSATGVPNVGDRACALAQYLPELDPDVAGRFEHRPVHLTTIRSDAFEDPGVAGVVFGAGGLLMETTFAFLHALLAFRAPRVGVWGVGTNVEPEYAGPLWPDWLGNAAAVGVRDRGAPFPWAPCPSCLHPALARRRARVRPAVVYEHYERSEIPLDLPRLRNDGFVDVEAAADFLGSAEAVVTNTYHGAYWATMLGARVVLTDVDWSTKFRSLAWDYPTLRDPRALGDALDRACARPDALEACRAETSAFWKRLRETVLQ